jgi:hypothetical protein
VIAEHYAVVSCHVEAPLDDRAWWAFSELQADAPGGLRIAALLRPPDPEAGEREDVWLDRARTAAARGPLGHHTHFVGPGHARPPRSGPEHAARVRAEAVWFRERGLEPRFFCGGGWYIDDGVAATLGELGYTDCTATAFRPGYLAPGAPRLGLDEPAWLTLDGVRLLELPTTHSLGLAARALVRRAPAGAGVHLYFHDTDLLDRRRRLSLRALLLALARTRVALDLDRLADEAAATAPERPFASVRG